MSVTGTESESRTTGASGITYLSTVRAAISAASINATDNLNTSSLYLSATIYRGTLV